MSRRNQCWHCAAIVMGWWVLDGSALAQTFPHKSLRLIVPFAAGGATDLVARTVGQQLSDATGRAVIVDNRPGAGGVLGTDIAAKSAADGYTLLLCSSGPVTISPGLPGKLPYDAARDIMPVTLVASIPYVLLVNTSSQVQSVNDLIALAKSKPGQLNYGSAGAGSTSHLAAELFKSMAKINVMHIPYKGSSLAIADLLGGHLNLYFDAVATALPSVRGGRARAVAIASRQRFTLLPEVPTMNEAGLPGYEVSSWYGVCVPAGTPAPVIAYLNVTVATSLTHATIAERFANIGAQMVTNSPDEFRQFIRAERAQWSRVIRESGAAAQL